MARGSFVGAFLLLLSAAAAAQTADTKTDIRCQERQFAASAKPHVDPTCISKPQDPRRAFDQAEPENPLYKRQKAAERLTEESSSFRFQEPQPLIKFVPAKRDSMELAARCIKARKNMERELASGSGDVRKLTNAVRGECNAAGSDAAK